MLESCRDKTNAHRELEIRNMKNNEFNEEIKKNNNKIFNMDETGLFYACVAFSARETHTDQLAGCHQTVDLLRRRRLV